ncbi:MAG: V-type ATP synthase subunit E [Clostridiales bacterium]|nr:V-type ATP synthase subunit E [Clostridiales bacterium]
MDNINQNYSVNEKLRSFTEMALKDAYRKKKDIIDNTEKEIRETIKNKEIELLEEAYRSIQTGTRDNKRELNEAISKALVDGKRKMFDKRCAIIEDVFKQVEIRLEKYRTTTEYPLRIMNEIIECFGIIGDSEYEIEVNENEKDLFKKLITESGMPIQIKASDEDIIGGFIMNGITKRIRIDYSFKTAAAEAKGKFLEICRIPIEDGDLLDD